MVSLNNKEEAKARILMLELMLHAYQFSADWRPEGTGFEGFSGGVKTLLRHQDSDADLDVWEKHRALLVGVRSDWSSKTDLLTNEVGDHSVPHFAVFSCSHNLYSLVLTCTHFQQKLSRCHPVICYIYFAYA